MKIYVDKIPPEGLELSEEIEAGPLSLDTEIISFVQPIKVKASARKTGGEVFIDVDLEAPVEYACSKCLAKFQNVMNKKFEILREAHPGQILEIDDDIRQELILDYPMRTLCRPDCKGLCPNCGQNLNVGECECEGVK